jgi:hypothetical protein
MKNGIYVLYFSVALFLLFEYRSILYLIKSENNTLICDFLTTIECEEVEWLHEIEGYIITYHQILVRDNLGSNLVFAPLFFFYYTSNQNGAIEDCKKLFFKSLFEYVRPSDSKNVINLEIVESLQSDAITLETVQLPLHKFSNTTQVVGYESVLKSFSADEYGILEGRKQLPSKKINCLDYYVKLVVPHLRKLYIANEIHRLDSSLAAENFIATEIRAYLSCFLKSVQLRLKVLIANSYLTPHSAKKFLENRCSEKDHLSKLNPSGKSKVFKKSVRDKIRIQFKTKFVGIVHII